MCKPIMLELAKTFDDLLTSWNYECLRIRVRPDWVELRVFPLDPIARVPAAMGGFVNEGQAIFARARAESYESFNWPEGAEEFNTDDNQWVSALQKFYLAKQPKAIPLG